MKILLILALLIVLAQILVILAFRALQTYNSRL